MGRLAVLGVALKGGLLAGAAALAETPAPAGTDRQAPVHGHTDLQTAVLPRADAILPDDGAVKGILCEADPPPVDASGALGLPATFRPTALPNRSVLVENPWAAEPVMTGAGPAVEVVFFKRGRTLIFDAGTEVLYLDRDNRRFTYMHSATDRVTLWHGTCHAEG